MITTHRVSDRDLPDGIGAVALRERGETVVHVSPLLPDRDSVVGHVLRAIHGDPAPYGGAVIGFAAALDLPRQRGVQPIRL
jgi:hypothetical protein